MKAFASLVVALGAYGAISMGAATYAADPASAISNEANAAVQRMGKTLAQENVSFRAKTMRVYQDTDGDYLHIVHNINVTAARPDRIAFTATGDDGATKFVYDGKQVSVFDPGANKYAQAPMTGSLENMLDAVSERLGVEFPLADFFSDDPAQAFLTGVISGKEIDTDRVDGTPCRHLFFTQSGATELELWVENNERAAPCRLVITYRALPGTPNFVAEFSDWNFQNRPSEAEFVFQPPAGATKVDVANIGRGTLTGGAGAPNSGREK
ncbi:MAG: DUF2092 domain-containing protein [Hyphomicrobiales bacterium]|nr:DUF2092 domain-containing protein [Hyphomicrobiales bacterium]